MATMQFPKFAVDVVDTLQKSGAEAYLVGGCVRDVLMGRIPKDYDVATARHPEVVRMMFPKVIDTGLKFGTVTVMTMGGPVEVTTFRGEGSYSDGRRPDQVTFSQDIHADLARRDFTMNAIAYDPVADFLVDPHGGESDILVKLIRTVGKPADRFSEDRLRVLRAIRFASQLGFNIDLTTLAAMHRYNDIDAVSAERVGQEVTKMLMGDAAEDAVVVAEALGLVPMFDRLRGRARLPLRVAHMLPTDTDNTTFAIMCRDNWRLPEAVTKEALALRRLAYALHELPDFPLNAATVRRFLGECQSAEVEWEDVMELSGYGSAAIETVARVAGANPPVNLWDLDIKGTDLVSILGKPGPAIGQLLRRLLREVLEDPTLNRADKLMGRAHQLVQQGDI